MASKYRQSEPGPEEERNAPAREDPRRVVIRWSAYGNWVLSFVCEYSILS